MSPPPAPPVSDRRVVFFDGVCNLCSGLVRFVLRHNRDRSIKFASMQSPLGQRVLHFYGLPGDAYETMLYVEDGRLYTKSTAALQIARRLARPWRWLPVFLIVPRPVRDWVYDRVAGNRYRLFGKQDQCYLPDAAVCDRFLDG